MDNPTLIKGLADAVAGPVAGTFIDPALRTVNGTTEGNFFFTGLPTGAVFAAPNGRKAAGDFGGNMLLGGAGNDVIQGGNGDDIIDGDAWLHVELLPNDKGVVGLDSQILREIRYDTTAGNVDTAVFTGALSGYTITGADALGFITIAQTPVAVAGGGGGVKVAPDGTDPVSYTHLTLPTKRIV